MLTLYLNDLSLQQLDEVKRRMEATLLEKENRTKRRFIEEIEKLQKKIEETDELEKRLDESASRPEESASEEAPKKDSFFKKCGSFWKRAAAQVNKAWNSF